MKKLSFILIATLLFISSLPSTSSAHSGGGIIGAILVPPIYRSESAFTIFPAAVGGLIVTIPAFIIGGTAHVIGYTIGKPFNKGEEYANTSAVYSGIGTVWLGATVTGAPFYVVEKTLYDLPNAIFSSDSQSRTTDMQQNGILEIQSSTHRSEKTHDELNDSTRKKIIPIEVVEEPTRACSLGVVSAREGVGKSTKPEIITGSASTMSHGYPSLGDEENK